MTAQALHRPSVDHPNTYVAERGRSHPLGAVPDADGINFAVFS